MCYPERRSWDSLLGTVLYLGTDFAREQGRGRMKVKQGRREIQ